MSIGNKKSGLIQKEIQIQKVEQPNDATYNEKNEVPQKQQIENMDTLEQENNILRVKNEILLDMFAELACEFNLNSKSKY